MNRLNVSFITVPCSVTDVPKLSTWEAPRLTCSMNGKNMDIDSLNTHNVVIWLHWTVDVDCVPNIRYLDGALLGP